MSEIITKLREGSKQLSLSLTALQFKQIEDYLSLLQKWNRVFNLTAIQDPTEMLTHHVLDSLAVTSFFEKGERFLDVGSGAGLPGLMLAIALPAQQFTLLDSNSKKTSFIKQTAHHLGLKNITVVTARIEDWQMDALFDGVISRAFSSLTDFVTLCERFLKPSGMLFAMKGPRVLEELSSFSRAHQLEKMKVPYLNEERYLVRIPRVS